MSKTTIAALILILALSIAGGTLFNINVGLLDFTSRVGGSMISISSFFLGIWIEKNWRRLTKKGAVSG